MNELYDLIGKRKLNSSEDVLNFCLKGEFEDVLDVSTNALAITQKVEDDEISPSLFNFSASLTLSGAGYPCDILSCRMSKMTELAKFSCLYSDRTTIYNPFDFVYFYLNPQGKQEMSGERFRMEATNAFMIVLEFRPLIERALIVFSKTISLVCSECKKKKDKMIKSIVKELENISRKTLFPLIKEKIGIEYGKGFFHLTGIESLVGDDIYFHYKKLPLYLKRNGKRIKSVKDLQYDNQLVQKIIGEAVDSLVFQKIDNLESLSQTYLTSNVLERMMLEKLQSQKASRVLNLFSEGLPVVQDLSYEEIIKTRDDYPDEFGSFQENVSDLVIKADTFETQREYNSYVSNKLKGDLKDLEKVQNEARKRLRSGGFVEGAFLGATIMISALSNSQIPGILSVVKAAYDCNKLVSEASEIQRKVEKSPLFFYYKLNKLKS